MQLKHEILNKLTAYSESLLDSHGHYVQCVIEDDWSTLADEILTLLQPNKDIQPQLQQTPCKTHVCHICGGSNGHTIECTSWCGNTVTV